MKIQDIILIILTLASIAIVVWYLFGDSPTFEQAILVLIVSFLFKIQTNITLNKTETRNLKTSFIHLAKDFKEHMKHIK